MSDLVGRIADLTPEKRKLLAQKLQKKLLAQRLQQEKEPVAEVQILPQQRNSNVFPLSFAQRGLWFLHQLDSHSAAYNMSSVHKLTGWLRVDALERSLAVVVQRHEVLRTTLLWGKLYGEEQPVQVIAPRLAMRVPVVDLCGWTASERDRQVRQLARAEAQSPFDLTVGPLLRVCLLRLDEQEHVLLCTLHHIISDSWSMGVLIHEITRLYQGEVSGEPARLPVLPIQYADYVLWQRQWLQGEVLEAQLAYWQRQLSGVPALELRTDYPRPAIQRYVGAQQALLLPPALLQGLRGVSYQEKATLFMTLLAAFQVLLMRYSGQQDIVIGTSIANRQQAGLQDLMGFFVNTLVLRSDVAGNPGFRQLLARVREVTLRAYEHQDLPFEKLVQSLQVERSLSYNPLFQVFFALLNAPTSASNKSLPGIVWSQLERESFTTRFDLSLILTEGEEGLLAVIEYNNDLFNTATITHLLQHWQVLLEAIVHNPEQNIEALPLLSEAEREQLLVQWDATARPISTARPVHQLFEQQVARTPDSIALVFEDEVLTYAALNRRANQLAHHLIGLGVGPEVLVGICLERSMEMIVGLLAVWKAGGAYVPLDPTYPQERLAFILQDARVEVLLLQSLSGKDIDSCHLATGKVYTANPNESSAETRERVELGGLGGEATLAGFGVSPNVPIPQKVLGLCASENALAYIIYTSGSTGVPKGVQVTHQGLGNLGLAQANTFALGVGSRVLQFASLNFDASAWEILMALLVGGSLHLVSATRVVADLWRVLQEQAITCVTLPPSTLAVLPTSAALPALQTLIVAGEACPVELMAHWAQGRRFFNAYGPTEATVCATVMECRVEQAKQTSLSLGQPLANTQLYLLDHHLQPVPIGVCGEIYLGGMGLARGYLHRPEATAERFIPHLYGTELGARLYRTGDMARIRFDGELEFVGRKDQQVKLRGYRIELGEIEATISKHPAIQQCVVLVRREEYWGHEQLVAYVVPNAETREVVGLGVAFGEASLAGFGVSPNPPIPQNVLGFCTKQENAGQQGGQFALWPSVAEFYVNKEHGYEGLETRQKDTLASVRSYLQNHLPAHMVPSVLIPLSALPLTPNGKIDRRALPSPAEAMLRGASQLAQQNEPVEALSYKTKPQLTALQELLIPIWKDVLHLPELGIDDSFFKLGGHSLSAQQVVSRMGEALQIEMPLHLLFEAPTIAELSFRLEDLMRGFNPSTERRKDIGTRYLPIGEVYTPNLNESSVNALVPMPRPDELPLSFAQERLWFLNQWDQSNVSYNIPLALDLTGQLSVQALEHSLAIVVQRHEVLRTTFEFREGHPVQVISPPSSMQIPVIDLRGWTAIQRDALMNALARAEAVCSFDLVHGPLLRVWLLRLHEQEHVLLLTLHHIISDGWSMGILVTEIAALYQAEISGKPSRLAELAIQYADYALWQRQWLQGGVLDLQLAYWKKQLAGIPALLELPTDRPRPAVQSYAGAQQTLLISSQLLQQLKSLSQRENVTLFMMLLATFQILLMRYSAQHDIVVGSPIANRWPVGSGQTQSLQSLIGFFVNTLVLRADLSGNPNFLQLLARVREVALQAYAHQDIPFEKLVQELQPERDLSRQPLFQVLFSLQNTPIAKLTLPGLSCDPITTESQTAKFDLSLLLSEEQAGLLAVIQYNTDLFDAATMLRLLQHWQTLLEAVVEHPEQAIEGLPLLTETERDQLLMQWNTTRRDSGRHFCVHQLFEQQAERTPDAVALVCDVAGGHPSQMTYQQLNGQANRLAHRLLELGVEPETLVGVCLERSLELVVALLAILKAGAAYVPLDQGLPQPRLSFLLSDAQPLVVLTQVHLYDRFSVSVPVKLLSIEDEGAHLPLSSQRNPVCRVEPDNLAYLIYTSGSTGQPKGVQIAHRALSNFMLAMQEQPGLQACDTLLAVTNISFDIAGLELFLPLVVGARVVIAGKQALMDAEQLARALREHGATIMQATPATWRLLLDSDWRADEPMKMLCGGEALAPDLADQLLGLGGAVWNLYGPTETTIWSTMYPIAYQVQPHGPLPIGRPIANTQIYVVDKNLQPVPIGVPGEILIGGVGLARGYFKRADLTAERMIPNPVAAQFIAPGQRLYRTGDMARYLPDGSLQYLGRSDQQVKLRGYRIELGEIEAVLSRHAGVREAVVMLREGRGADKGLVAYIVARSGETLSVSSVQRYLRELLPDYMVPTSVVFVETISLTPNGKVDRKALQAINLSRTSLPVAEDKQLTPLQELLISIWQDVLGLSMRGEGVETSDSDLAPTLGIDDNFFEKGGHSLLATQVVSRIRHMFRVDLSLHSFFEAPTIAALASLLEELMRGSSAHLVDTLVPVERPNDSRLGGQVYLPLSFAQERLWFLDQWYPGSAWYNIPLSLRLAGRLEISALEQSLATVIQRHEALRTTFAWREGQPVQSIAPSLSIQMPLIDLRDWTATERDQQVMLLARAEALCGFDLVNGPLLRVYLLWLDEQEYVLLFTLHHIIADGWSMQVLVREMTMLYRAAVSGEPARLPALPIQYTDYAIWQRQQLQSAEARLATGLEHQLAYWKKQLADAPRVLELPTDHPRPAQQSDSGAQETLSLAPALLQELKRLSQQEGVTLFMTLLAAFQILLMRYSNQEDIVVGTPIANRQHPGLEDLIGFFANTLVLRSDLAGNPSFLQLLAREREMALQAYVHQDIPFEKLVEELQPERDLSRQPLFQVLFSLQNIPVVKLELPGLHCSSMHIASQTAKFDLSLLLTEEQAGLQAVMQYNTDLFNATTIKRLLRHWQTLLVAIVQHPEQDIATLPLLGKTGREQILGTWNATSSAYPQELCVHQLFEQQVQRTPDAVALVFEDEILTYMHLNHLANQLAHHLQGLVHNPQTLWGMGGFGDTPNPAREASPNATPIPTTSLVSALGIGPDAPVGICLQRSLAMSIGVLAILKAGGVVVPLDPDDPQERLAFLCADAQIRVLLTQQQIQEQWQGSVTAGFVSEVKTVVLERDWPIIMQGQVSRPDRSLLPEHLCYIIYTSGSTGTPKGVGVPHRVLVNLLSWHARHMLRGARTLQFARLSFDASFHELFAAWCTGGMLFMVAEAVRSDVEALVHYLHERAIEKMIVPVVILHQLVRQQANGDRQADWYDPSWASSLQEITTTGEQLQINAAVAGVFEQRENVVLHNHYGPSETHVVTAYTLEGSASQWPTYPPIGQPIANTDIYILDKYGQPVPIGVVGELYIGGMNLARGYVGRADQTAERFVPHPFVGTLSDTCPQEGQRLYRTGDQARYRADGIIEYVGRKDQQVKLRGYRIELGEVEAALLKHALIREAVVLLHEDGRGEQQLTAYVVGSQELTPMVLRRYLQDKLPTYMIPAFFVLLQALPLTSNGKVDRRALLSIAFAQRDQKETLVTPSTPLQELLGQIWQDVLGLSQISIHDNFFALGGHSLLATQVVARIRQAIKANMPLRGLFEAPTLATLASYLEASMHSDELREVGGSALAPIAEILPVQRPDDLPLSFAQERLWFLDQLVSGSAWYNVPVALRLSGPLSVAALQHSIATVVQRHEVLRTTFELREGRPRQVIAPTLPIQVPVINLMGLIGDQRSQQVAKLARAEARRSFDVAHGPLLRACLLRLTCAADATEDSAPQEHVLLFTLHHIITDGWSMGVLVRELTALYEAEMSAAAVKLPELPIQYADYTLWQRQWLHSEVLDTQLAYWRKQLLNLSPLTLPTDHLRPAVKTERGATQSRLLPLALSEGLLHLSQQQDVTLFMLLLAALQVLLLHYTGQTDVSVGTTLAHRTRAELEGMIGFFVNTVVLRVDLAGNPSFEQVLRRVREVCLEAYVHQDIPFEKVVAALEPERDMSHSPFFNVMIVLHNTPLVQEESLVGINMEPLALESTTSKFDLTFSYNPSTGLGKDIGSRYLPTRGVYTPNSNESSGNALTQSRHGLQCTLEYSTDLFEADTITRMLDHWQTLLQGILQDVQAPIADLPLLTDAERESLLIEWNATETDYPHSLCLHQLFEQQVLRTPDAVALIFGQTALTYLDLNRRADQLAYHLQTLGVGFEMLVGICIERSPAMIVSLLAVLKAAGAYVPLDPSYPQERLQYMIEDADIALLLTQEQLQDLLPREGYTVVCLDEHGGFVSDVVSPHGDYKGQDHSHMPYLTARQAQGIAPTPEQLAYVLYTSGSTGRPKGVMIPHRGLVNYVYWAMQAYGASGGNGAALHSPIGFDLTVTSLFVSLLRGQSVMLLPEDAGIEELANALSHTHFNLVKVTPSHLEALNRLAVADAFNGGAQVWVIGGEALQYESLSRLRSEASEQIKIINEYGPTETVVGCCVYELPRGIEPAGAAPIGRPIANMQVYVLDKHLQPVSVGVYAELYIAGVGVARGYLKRPEQTAERFIPHPWSAEPGARLYRTGDLVRYRADGVLEYAGRIDQQVKVRGYRIEPGEIEAVLRSNETVQESVVVVYEEELHDKQLVAYVVPALDTVDTLGWQEEQIQQWQLLYDDTYRIAPAQEDPTLNLVGWTSSYTGQPIPTEEMSEQIEHTVARILARHPQRVVEIGVGTGMLAFRIAPQTSSYLASDFSVDALRYVQRVLDTHPLPQVHLMQKIAHEAIMLPAESVDAVIINSVVQYFPDISYLLQVLQGAFAALQPGGFLFIGDVRNLILLRAYVTSVELYRASDSLSRAEVHRRVQQRILEEEELLIDPAFFHALQRELPQVGQVLIQLKRGHAHNELTRYRYDVVVRKEATEEPLRERVQWEWSQEWVTYMHIEEQLREQMPDVLHIHRVPDLRLERALQAVAWVFGGQGAETVGDWRNEQEGQRLIGLDPEVLWELGERWDYHVSISWSSRGDSGECEVVFSKGKQLQTRILPRSSTALPARTERPATRWLSYANNPLQGKMMQQWLPQLRTFLQQHLPEYMIPAHFVVLEALPLTPNGKVDRRALPAPNRMQASRGGTFVAPQTPLQERLAAIWAELLHMPQIGIHDNFFELGGHSLLATQVVARIRQTLGVELALRRIFEAPTIELLAGHLEGLMQAVPSTEVHALLPMQRPDELPLSFAQERLWFLHQWDQQSSWYNVPLALRLCGSLHVQALEGSLAAVVQRHEVLRTTFKQRSAQPVQVIAERLLVRIAVIDLRGWAQREREEQVLSLARTEAQRSFDLANGPLWRACLLQLDEQESVLLLTLHHIVFDGWSAGVLVREITTLYQAHISGRPSPLPQLPLQYADYTLWQREFLQGEVLLSQLAYWKEQLAKAPALLELPTDRPRPAIQSYAGAKQLLQIAPPLLEQLKSLSQREGVTLFMTMLATFQVLLMRYSGQQDILVGTPIANRKQAELESLIGFFVNTLVLRTDLSGNPGFRQLLARVREVALQAYAHQDIPFEKLVEELQPERDLSRQPLFQVLFSLQNTPLHRLELPGLAFHPIQMDGQTSKFDLSLMLNEEPAGLRTVVEYSTDLFAATTITRLLQHWQTLLEAVVRNPEQGIETIPLLTEAEREQLLVQWNATASLMPTGQCVHQLFEQQAEQTPDSVAVVFADEVLTYSELNRQANQLAHHLQRLSVGPEVLVGICLERSIEMIIGLLAVLKAGGAYVPLDPTYPQERLAFMLQDAQVQLILTRGNLIECLPQDEVPFFLLDQDWMQTGLHLGSHNPASNVTAQNLAYVMYTSGSTGQPKGVCIPHQAVVRLVRHTNYIQLEPTDRIVQAANIAFDAATFELWGAWLNGATLVMVMKEELLSLAHFAHLLEVQAITTLFLTTALFNQLAREVPHAFQGLRHLLFGGEAVDPHWVRQVLIAGAPQRLLHVYGPTETTTYASWSLIEQVPEQASTIPIGTALTNTQLYVVDAHMQPVPIGVSGELYIGGAGLGRCYLNRAELTAEKFVPNPFSQQPGARLYRTGDLVCYHATGDVVYLGRTDHQVKLRGFRIELGEIEAALRTHPAVQEAVLMLRERRPDSKYLVAYVVARAEQSSTVVEARLASILQVHLGEHLPEYMVPTSIILLDSMPLTPNGKVDRTALLAIGDPVELAHLHKDEQQDGVLEAAHTPLQELLASIWKDVLGLPQVDIHDNFFELGGHSLLATQVVARIRQSFGVDLPLRSLFEEPTIVALAGHLEGLMRTEPSLQACALVPMQRPDELPLSFAQERLWFLHQWDQQSAWYNIPLALRLCGSLHVQALEGSLAAVVQRHEVLRTTFKQRSAQPVQVIAASLSAKIAVIDLRGWAQREREEQVLLLARAEAQRSFDLANGPLWRACLLQLDEQESVLLLTLHHIVFDGWSAGVLVREITTLYQAHISGQPSPLPQLPLQYADYTLWQREFLQGEVLLSQLAYWKEQLADLPPLALPTDYPRPTIKTERGATQSRLLPPALLEKLAHLCQQQGVTLFMLLLATFQVLLMRYTGQTDLSVGTPIANRTCAELEGMIGFFVNTLVLRTDLSGNPTFEQVLTRVREVCLGAYIHQDIPFEKLVEECLPERDMSRSPLFQVMFILQNVPLVQHAALENVSIEPLALSTATTSQFDLTLSAAETAQGLYCSLEYSTDLFEAATITRMLHHWQPLLQGIVQDPQARVADLPLLTEAERDQLFMQWETTRRDSGRDLCVHQLFEQQAERTPDAVALVCDVAGGHPLQMTYQQLNGQANRLAHRLLELGVEPETLVGVCLERSLELVVALLATLKAGAAYVPLDQGLPQPRLSFLLSDAQPSIVLTQAHLYDRFPVSVPVKLLSIEDTSVHPLPTRATLSPQRNPVCRVEPDNLAYLIYTSGSTGQPKGVQVAHRALSNFMLAMQEQPGLQACDTLLAVTNISFDIAGLELFLPLVVGARVVIAGKQTVMDAEQLARALREHRATVMQATPATWRLLLDSDWRADEPMKMLCGGEALAPDLADQLLGLGGAVWNLYGPTETTIWSTIGPVVGQGQSIWAGHGPYPLGGPIANTQIYLLDSYLQPVPIGVRGEIMIGGAGLARGYFKRADLTAERMIPNPVAAQFIAPGQRLYRTGDMARYLPDGSLQYLGRSDQQVKLRGYRIELGEIEAVLSRHAGVREAAVMLREGRGADKGLVAYIVARSGETLSVSSVREYLRELLPDYMVPTSYILLDALPFTTHGKVDRRTLALKIPTKGLEQKIVAPRTRIEKALAAIWTELLDLEQVSITDNFFAVGGHSLLAIQLLNRMNKAFASLKLSLPALFQIPTIEQAAAFIQKETRELTPFPLVALQRAGEKPPFFCVHPGPGVVSCFIDLAKHLDHDRPFYGIQAPGLMADHALFSSIEEMATFYIEELLTVQPDGPYLLGGYSFGGLVAFEMARQLQMQGCSVALLAILDTYPLGQDSAAQVQPLESAQDDAREIVRLIGLLDHYWRRQIQLSYDDLCHLEPDEQLAHVLAQLKEVQVVPEDMDIAQLRRLIQVDKAHGICLQRYRPQPYRGRITLLRTEGTYDPVLWAAFSSEPVEVHTVEGDHFTMIVEPYVKSLASKLQHYIDKA